MKKAIITVSVIVVAFILYRMFSMKKEKSTSLTMDQPETKMNNAVDILRGLIPSEVWGVTGFGEQLSINSAQYVIPQVQLYRNGLGQTTPNQ